MLDKAAQQLNYVDLFVILHKKCTSVSDYDAKMLFK